MTLKATIAKVLDGTRLEPDEAFDLYEKADLPILGMLADEVRKQVRGNSGRDERVVTYIIDRNINPTNVCITDCGFCAFYRRPGDEEAYVLEREVIHEKIDELRALGGIQLLLQGGHHPYLKTEWFAELFRDIKERYPDIWIHGMSPPEIVHLAQLEKTTLRDVIARLKDAGLDSIPGGGAEILVDRVRDIISPKKATTEEWLDVMRQAAHLGLRTTATMMFGHVETPAERIEHLARVRELQEECGVFTAFIPWTFQHEHTPMETEWKKTHRKATSAEYLRMLAISRIFLHNIDNIQSSWVTQGIKICQVGLSMGANDFGSAMLEENVVSSAGCYNMTTIEEIERHIRDAGFTPRRRNMLYQHLDENNEPEPGSPPAGPARPGTMWLPPEDIGSRGTRPLESPGSATEIELADVLIDRVGLGEIRRKVDDGERLSFEDGVTLYEHPNLAAVGALANRVRLRRHGRRAFFNINLHIDYTNICIYSCKFCAFAAKLGEDRAYLMTPKDIEKRLAQFRDTELSEVHMVAGLHPHMPYSYYLDIVRAAKRGKPDVHVKAFTMVEIDYILKLAAEIGKTEDEVFEDLREAGLGSCPGGGAEVLTTRIWKAVFREKTSPRQWLATARKVQEHGFKMNATMLYGHVERVKERVEHFCRLRELQDETGSFMTFIPLAFWPYNTQLEHYGKVTTGWNDLRQVAVSRLMLDNFPHIKAYWIMLTPRIAQTALAYGANDLDGTVKEERITHDAGTSAPMELPKDELLHLIRSAGYEPVLRDTTYEHLQPVG